MTCNVTGTARRPDGAVYANGSFSLVPAPATVAAYAGEVVIPEPVTFTSDVNCAVDFDVLPGNYIGTVGTRRFFLAVPDEAAVDFADCVDAAAITAWPGAVETVLDARDAVLDAVGNGAISPTPPTAAALIAAAATAGVKHVSLRQVIGSSYTTATDAAAILNAVWGDLAAAGIQIINDEALELSLQTKLYIVDNLYVDFGPAILWRDWGGVGAAAVAEVLASRAALVGLVARLGHG